MIDATHSQCRKCSKSRHIAACFRVEVSRLEAGMGHEKFRCERCGSLYKIIPQRDREPKVVEVA